MKLKNNVAIVTGGANGIGKAIALEFAKQGAKVVICDIDKVAGKEVVNQIERLGYKAIFVKADVTKKNDVQRTIKRTIKDFEKIDVLINNAGIFIQEKISKIKEEEWDNLINTNLKGMYLFISCIAEHMIEHKRGKIISIGSIFGEVGYNNTSVYSAANGGIISLTKAVALELAPYRINVNIVSPGIIATKMNEDVLTNPELKKKIISNIPLERIGIPEEIADAVVFLASNRSDFITGHNLIVDGGWTIH